MNNDESVNETDFNKIDEWSSWKALIQMAQSSDAFGKTVADNTVTKADISSEYVFNPERLRFYDGGNRVFLQYVSSSKFDDSGDTHSLLPNADNILKLETAERFRYTVGNVISLSRAFEANKIVDQLQGDDKIILGYGDPDLENNRANSDGWFWEWDSSLEGKQVRLTEYRDGERVFSNVTNMNTALDTWKRVDDKLNWYNVGVDKRIETFTKEKNDGFTKQINDTIGTTSNVDGKGPISGNKHVTFTVQTDANTSDLELNCGSIAAIVLGNHTAQVRTKAASLIGLSHSGSGLYEPLFAIRRDPSSKAISTDITSVDLDELSVDADAQVLVISVDASKTDASNWQKPKEHSEINSAIQFTTDITSYPDSNGNIVDGSTGSEYTDNPGGYQLSLANRFTQSQGTANIRRSSTSRFRKRKIQNGDVAVFLGLTNTSLDYTITYDTEQDF